MSKLRRHGISELVTPETRKKAADVIAFELAEKIAKRVKDASALEKALLGKLTAQRDFAAEYKTNFHPGGNREHYDTSVVMVAEEWCKAHGFHIRTVQRWCDLLDDAIFVDQKNAILKKCWQLAELQQAANYMSESNEWFTPARYVEAVRELLGDIDLDPASNQFANATVQAKVFFTIEDDGLQKDWYGRFFMNPPYGKTDDNKSLAAEFCNKAIAEYECGNVKAGIILVNSLHSQSWQAPLYKYPICFVDHRIQFITDDGRENKNPTFQNIFIYLGRELTQFVRVFSRFGYVMHRLTP